LRDAQFPGQDVREKPKIKRENVMDDNKGTSRSERDGRLTHKEEEELFSAIIAGYLKDKVDLEIYPKGISIREKSNPDSREIFFPFDEDNEDDEK
jgi:hypothetical protein